jgi:ABC-type transport system involved in multi-copper enzyme maturation permease subunit
MSSVVGVGPILLFALAIVAVVVVVLVFVVRPLRELAMTEGAQRSARAAELRVRARNGVAILAATTIAVIGVGTSAGSSVTGAGRVLGITPMVAIGAAILVFVIAPTPEFLEQRALRTAELRRRVPRDFVSRRTLAMPAVAAGVLAVALVGFWLAADPTGQSISHTSDVVLPDGGTTSSTSSPYPGFYYGVPLLLALIGVSAVTAAAIARIAAAPRPTDPSLRAADDATRTLAIRAVTAAATSAMVFTLGGVLYIAAAATANVGARYEFRINAVPIESGSDAALVAISTAEFVGAGLAILAGITLIAFAIGHAMRRPFAVTPAPSERVA